MESEERNNFLYYFQRLKFKETKDYPFLTASIKRKCLAQEYFASLNLGSSNETTCTFLEDRLREYSSLVDKSGDKEIDNYMCLIPPVAQVSCGRDGWRSQLKDPKGRIDKLLSSWKCEESKDGTVVGCHSSEVTDQGLHVLLNSKTTLNVQPAVKKSNSFENKVTASNPSSTATATPGYIMVGSASRGQATQQDETVTGSFGGAQTFRGSFSSKPAYRTDQEGTSDPRCYGVPRRAPNSMFPGRPPQRNRTESGRPFGSFGGPPHRGEPEEAEGPSMFRTATAELGLQNQRKWGGATRGRQRQLGSRAGIKGRFVPPGQMSPEDAVGWEEKAETDERLKNIDPKMVELIRSEIMDSKSCVEWDDIAGLEFAKTTIQEIVVWPLLRPDIFTGLRRPPKGILLFGPPGTGKTLIGKCIASQSHSTFFSISASSLTSKWIGEGEKMVRALFAVARCHQPAVVFIDEIDSLLTQRSDSEHESSRRMKTEFLVQLDGAATGEEDRILIIGATNRPQELDEAARRRLVKKLYIPLPELSARQQLVKRVMAPERHSLTDQDVCEVAGLTAGYSGADMKSLCQEASLGPIRSLGLGHIERIRADQVRPVSFDDFKNALSRVRATVAQEDLKCYLAWDKQYGSGGVAVSQGTAQ